MAKWDRLHIHLGRPLGFAEGESSSSFRALSPPPLKLLKLLAVGRWPLMKFMLNTLPTHAIVTLGTGADFSK